MLCASFLLPLDLGVDPSAVGVCCLGVVFGLLVCVSAWSPCLVVLSVFVPLLSLLSFVVVWLSVFVVLLVCLLSFLFCELSKCSKSVLQRYK